jgi:Flp pilus assembly pilin Flp
VVPQPPQGNFSPESDNSRNELRREPVAGLLHQLWFEERGQDIAEYAVMLAVILVIVVGTIRLIGSNANNVFSSVGSAIQ